MLCCTLVCCSVLCRAFWWVVALFFAVLSRAVLCCAVFMAVSCCFFLFCAVRRWFVLCGAVLCCAVPVWGVPRSFAPCTVLCSQTSYDYQLLSCCCHQEQSGQRKELYRLVVESNFDLLTSILLPNAPRSGSPTVPNRSPSSNTRLSGGPMRPSSGAPGPQELPTALINITFLSMRILNTIARVHMDGLQNMIHNSFKVPTPHQMMPHRKLLSGQVFQGHKVVSCFIEGHWWFT